MYKAKKSKMPEGWVRVTWKDSEGKKWADNMPKSTYGHFQGRVLSKGGVVIKEED